MQRKARKMHQSIHSLTHLIWWVLSYYWIISQGSHTCYVFKYLFERCLMLSLLEFITYLDLSDRGQVFAIRYPVQKCNPQFNSVNIPVQKIAIIHLKGNSRPTIWGSITFFLAMQICVRVKLGVLIDKIILSFWTCHQKMEIVIVIGWSVFQGSVQISQATMSWENTHP